VQVKTVEQQDVQALHRLREARVGERTALCNQVRGLLGEYGIVLPKGVSAVRKRLPELLEDAENGLRNFLRPLLEVHIFCEMSTLHMSGCGPDLSCLAACRACPSRARVPKPKRPFVAKK